MKKNFNVLREVIAHAKESAEKELIHLEQNKTVSLIDVLREDWDDIEFLLAFYKKRHGSSYRHLAKLFAKRGIIVSESTLRTTYFRISKEKNKKRQASENKDTPPNVEAPVVEVQVADPGEAVVSPAPTTQDAHEVPPESPFVIDEDLIGTIDWETEYTRLDKTGIFDPWNEEDQFIYCVIYWLAEKYEITIHNFVYVSMSTHPKDMNVARTATALYRRAKKCGMPVEVPARFASVPPPEDIARIEAKLKG